MLGMLGQPKKVASIIISSMAKKTPEGNYEKEKPEVDESDDELTMLAEEILSRIKNDDAKGLASCLKTLTYKLGAEKPDDDEGQEDA